MCNLKTCKLFDNLQRLAQVYIYNDVHIIMAYQNGKR